MNTETWAAVDARIIRALHPPDATLDAALQAASQAGLPAINVSPAQGKFLSLLASIQGASAILEIGALGGYSTIWLARALPPGGRLVTLELDPGHAEVALSNVDHAGLASKVQIIVGPAAESLARLHAENRGPFDLIFIDADKTGYCAYLQWSLKLARPGTVIIADNVVRRGQIIDPDNPDPNVRGVRAFIDLVAATPSLSATVLQTVGEKGHDGFLIARVLPWSPVS